MISMKSTTMAGALSALLLVSGCNDSDTSSSSGSGNSGGDPATTEISGIATAPAGTVAYLENPDIFHLAMDFLVPSVAAEITGFDPVEGADVELIRVDDQGNQIGEVLATTKTSITGEYTLTLPQDVDLAGDLVVRITGQNNSQLRAQVVEEEVDISPVSEFVLQKFIEQGADLGQLEVSDVVFLSGRVEEFDLTLSDAANLEGAFEALEEAVGDFVESEVAVIASGQGDMAEIEGNYLNASLSFELHDDDGGDYGDYTITLGQSDFTFSASEDGLAITHGMEESAYSGITGLSLATGSVYHEVEIEDEGEELTGTYTDTGLLSIQGSFDEETGDEDAWRYPAATYNLQQVEGKGLFFLLSNEAAIRFGIDPETGALDPDSKQGDEVFRTLEVFSRQPTAFKNEDLAGDFGTITLASRIEQGSIELEHEVGTATFMGDGTFDYNGGNYHVIQMNSGGSISYTEETEDPETGLSIAINETGRISSIGGEEIDGFINDTGDVLVRAVADGTDGAEAETEMTLMVKLPDSAPSVSDNTYRLMLLSQTLGSGEEFQLTSSSFNTYVEMTSETEGSISGSTLLVEKSGLAGNLETELEELDGATLTASIAAAKATLTIADDDGTAIMEGFFNEDASLGIFGFRYADTDSDPEELGLAVLIKVTD